MRVLSRRERRGGEGGGGNGGKEKTIKRISASPRCAAWPWCTYRCSNGGASAVPPVLAASAEGGVGGLSTMCVGV